MSDFSPSFLFFSSFYLPSILILSFLPSFYGLFLNFHGFIENQNPEYFPYKLGMTDLSILLCFAQSHLRYAQYSALEKFLCEEVQYNGLQLRSWSYFAWLQILAPSVLCVPTVSSYFIFFFQFLHLKMWKIFLNISQSCGED